MKTQYERIGRLLTRPRGATALEIIQTAGTVSPHSRMSEMKARGWRIVHKPIKGKSYGSYHGKKPKAE